jgi:hypothetical protein
MCINCRAERDGFCSKAKYKATACSKMPGFSESSFRMLHIPAATLSGIRDYVAANFSLDRLAWSMLCVIANVLLSKQ